MKPRIERLNPRSFTGRDLVGHDDLDAQVCRAVASAGQLVEVDLTAALPAVPHGRDDQEASSQHDPGPRR